MKYLLCDFNGTLLDDVDVCLECVNYEISKYLKRDPLTKEEYLKVFTFPVIDYYKKVGFDFEKASFEEIGADWMEMYNRLWKKAKVYEDVVELLKRNKEMGNKNILFSASKLEMLKEYLKELELDDLFDEVLGIDNIYASSKKDIGLSFIKDKNKDDCLLIGDTSHDAEVAEAMGIRCILIARGHQSKEILEKYEEVYDTASEVKLC